MNACPMKGLLIAPLVWFLNQVLLPGASVLATQINKLSMSLYKNLSALVNLLFALATSVKAFVIPASKPSTVFPPSNMIDPLWYILTNVWSLQKLNATFISTLYFSGFVSGSSVPVALSKNSTAFGINVLSSITLSINSAIPPSYKNVTSCPIS